MNRYVLRYEGKGPPPALDLARIRSVSGLKVVDEGSSRMWLVEATEAAVRQLAEMPSWVVSPETVVPVPDTRKKVRWPS